MSCVGSMHLHGGSLGWLPRFGLALCRKGPIYRLLSFEFHVLNVEVTYPSIGHNSVESKVAHPLRIGKGIPLSSEGTTMRRLNFRVAFSKQGHAGYLL